MQPNDSHQNGRVGTPQASGGALGRSAPPVGLPQRQQEAAANLIRSQLDAIYDGAALRETGEQPQVAPAQPAPQTQTPATPQPQPQPASQQAQADAFDVNPYDRTHAKTTSIQPEQWKHYHSAWQDYYKKYYEQYYTQQVQSATAQLQRAQPAATLAAAEQPRPAEDAPDETSRGITQTQAMQELRQKLLDKVEASAKKARGSRHFVPIAAAVVVLLVVGFVQYNPVIVASAKAFVSPGASSMSPEDFAVDPMSDVEVGPEPRLIINKINVNTPVFYDIATDTVSQNKAMENGVAHFPIPGANSHPGEVGNTVLSGHSSNDVFAAGDYKFIFMQLDKLEIGDTIYANYNSKRYTYVVTKKEEVLPSEVSKLVYETDKPVMTLITCTPLGTALRRLLVTAEQVYPSPTEAAPAPEASGTPSGTTTGIPGQGERSLFERLFGG